MKVLPCYRVLSASMVPWWSVMILSVTAKPNPIASNYFATNETSQKFQRVEYMVSLSGTDICGEEDFRFP